MIHWLPRRRRARPSAALDDDLYGGPNQAAVQARWAALVEATSKTKQSTCTICRVTGHPVRSFARGYFHLDDVLAKLEDRTISVCIPARNEESTVGVVVSTIASELTSSGTAHPLIDAIVVVDDNSTDRTGPIAAEAGAHVIAAGAHGGGKGQAMAAGLAAIDSDFVLFLDADVTNFTSEYVVAMVAPLLYDDSLALVKGTYRRPLRGSPDEGGRATELVAKPIIELLFPHLEQISQPLAGETAAPRAVLDKITLAKGYGVEIAMLIDITDIFGVDSVAQVDLGTRVHRNRPLLELRPLATEVMREALARSRLPSAAKTTKPS